MTGARGYLVLASSGVFYAAAAAFLAASAGLLITSAINTGISSGDGTMCGKQAPFGRSLRPCDPRRKSVIKIRKVLAIDFRKYRIAENSSYRSPH